MADDKNREDVKDDGLAKGRDKKYHKIYLIFFRKSNIMGGNKIKKPSSNKLEGFSSAQGARTINGDRSIIIPLARIL